MTEQRKPGRPALPPGEKQDAQQPKEITMSKQATTTTVETETWVAWLDGKRNEAVEFEVPVAGTYDVAEAGAAALGIDVCEELNIKRA